MDNGNGMDYDTIHKMLSFGYSDKVAKAGKAPIGMYGNGFKSGSMRLGKDAIVFSRSKSVRCVGMLSQTYLREIQTDQIVVPIVCFEKSGSHKFTVSDENKASLQDILRYSLFKTQEELLAEIDAITFLPGKNTGTRIIIWNLRGTSVGTSEFDFETDRYDIRLPRDVYEDTNDNSQSPAVKSNVPDMVHSLRAYCRILYLKPRMQIIIRGQNVKSELIAKSLANTRKDNYKPLFLKKPVPITFGYNTRSKEQYGVMMYHKNRLIKAYERVGCQLRAISKGVGVIAVIECDFLDPTHNKQNFLESDKYRKTMNSLGAKLEEYWEEIRYKKKKENPNGPAIEDTIEKPDQTWVHCDSCQKWRKLPDGVDSKKLPDKWYCHLNPDPQFRNCEVEEEPEELEDEQPYHKTYKQQQKDIKKKKKQETEEPNNFEQVFQKVAKANKTLDRHYSRLRKKLFEKPGISPRTPTTNATKLVEKETISGGSPGSVLSPALNAVCSPGSEDFLPVNTDICSLATPPHGQKRPQTDKALTSSKKPKVLACPEPSVPEKAADVNAQVPDSDINKQEEEKKESQICMQMEHGDSEASDPAESNVGVGNATTQTDIRVKLENLSQIENDVMAAQIFRPRSIDPPIHFSPHQIIGEDERRHSSICSSVHPSVSEIQQLRGQVEELTKERNSLQEQVQMLTSQLQEAQARPQAVPEPAVEQQCSSPEEGLDYKSLFEKAQLRVDELVKDKEALQAAAESKPREVQCQEEGDEDASMQFDGLLTELDECRIKRDEVLSECEQLRLKLKQAEDAQNGAAVSSHAGPGKAEMPAESFAKSLRELRQNVARLLIRHLPALELDQINYDCNVIDEILEQCLGNL